MKKSKKIKSKIYPKEVALLEELSDILLTVAFSVDDALERYLSNITNSSRRNK